MWPLGPGHAGAGPAPTPFATAHAERRAAQSYTDVAKVAKEGRKIYLSHDCNGCHGGGGGGGMAAPLTNEVWIYGADDDTLFRIIALGTGALSPGIPKTGLHTQRLRERRRPHAAVWRDSQNDDDIWKIIAWIRLVYCERHPAAC